MTPAQQAAPALSIGALYLVLVLTLTNAVSFVDRQILVLLVDPIRSHLNANDTQIGLLQGPAFGLLYAFVGVFLGRLADRTHRIRLLLIGMGVWSGMTIACAFADNFWLMFACRMGVGVGEAVLTPVAASLIADRVGPEQRGRAMSVFVMGNSLGSGAAMIGGGAFLAFTTPRVDQAGLIAGLEPWQWAFILCGTLAIPMLLMILPIKEPPRRARDDAGTAAAASDPVEDLAVLKANLPRISLLIAAFCLLGIVGWGAGSWIPTFFVRTFELKQSVVGQTYGLIVLCLAPLGVISGGILGDRLRAKGRADAPAIVGLIGALTLCGSVIGLALSPTLDIAWWVSGVYAFFQAFAFGVVYAALTELSPNRYRGQVVAVYALMLNVLGFGLGPTTIGLANDFLFPGPKGVGSSLILLASVYGGLALAAFLAVGVAFRRAGKPLAPA